MAKIGYRTMRCFTRDDTDDFPFLTYYVDTDDEKKINNSAAALLEAFDRVALFYHYFGVDISNMPKLSQIDISAYR